MKERETPDTLGMLAANIKQSSSAKVFGSWPCWISDQALKMCLLPEVGCFWRKMKPLYLLRTLNKSFAMMTVIGLRFECMPSSSKLLG